MAFALGTFDASAGDCDPIIQRCDESLAVAGLLESLDSMMDDIHVFLYATAGFLIIIFGLFSVIRISRKLMGIRR